MSIALNARIKRLEEALAELREQARAERFSEIEGQVRSLKEEVEARLTALENRPKPGRPPKNG